MRISIIHPSRSRPEMAFETYEKWVNTAESPLEYILSLDVDDPHIVEYNSLFFNEDIIVIFNTNKSAIEAINNGAKIATGDLLIVVSDDFDCPEHWDTLLLEALKDKSDFLVKTQDGIQKTLITLPIMDRIYYERFGYIYEPSYIHMSSDVEMTMVGYMLDKIITLPLLFTHNHYSTGKIAKDAISEKNDSTYAHGHSNLARRQKLNFGLDPKDVKKNWRSIRWH